MLSEKRGDPQARAELLGELLKHAGFEPYMLLHGGGRDCYHVVILRTEDVDVEALAKALDNPVQQVRIGPVTGVAFPTEPGRKIGEVSERYYNPETNRWTGSISFRKIP